MKKNIFPTFIAVIIVGSNVACNKMNFQNQQQSLQQNPPVEPPKPLTCQTPQPAEEQRELACPIAGQIGLITEKRSYVCSGTSWIATNWLSSTNSCRFPNPNMKSGECVQGQALSSCLNCPQFSKPKWQPSTKAEKLAAIMFMSCPFQAKDNPGFPLPTLEKTLSLIQACTQQLYPESKAELNAKEYSTIEQLLNEESNQMRKKLFSGIWYQRPYTDHFEAYFGLTQPEAAHAFCQDLGPSALVGPLLTSDWFQHCEADPSGPSCQNWLSNKKYSLQFHRTQEIRKQLFDCLGKSTELPPVQPWQPPRCQFQSFEGYFENGGQQHLAELMKKGFSFSVEYRNQCYSPGAILPSMKGEVKISGYRCETVLAR